MTSTTIESRKGSAAFLNSLPVCTLPGVDRIARAENGSGPPDAAADPNDIEDRLAGVSSELAARYRSAVTLATDPKVRIVALVTQAATLNKLGSI